jgi:molybdate transport system regulatory protein
MPKLPPGILRIRIPHGEIFAMGPGKAELLEAIQETRSIAAAGRAMGLSYWKTRRLLDEMSACFRSPVVETAKGGEQGGGAQLTELGREALARFRAMEAKAAKVIQADLKAYQRLLAKKA